MRGPTKVILCLLILFGLVIAPQASASTTYQPPYATVVKGGDTFNFFDIQGTCYLGSQTRACGIGSGFDDGRITIVRAGTAVPGFSCGGSGGFAKFRLTHTVTEPVSSISFSYVDTALGAYAWIITSITGGTKWWGATQERGPLAGDGVLTVPLVSPGPEIGTTLTIDFGLEVSSACPNVEGGTVRFTEVTLS